VSGETPLAYFFSDAQSAQEVHKSAQRLFRKKQKHPSALTRLRTPPTRQNPTLSDTSDALVDSGFGGPMKKMTYPKLDFVLAKNRTGDPASHCLKKGAGHRRFHPPPSTQHPAPSTQNPAPSTQHPAPSTLRSPHHPLH
jgi:hypothetical protein